MNFLRGVFWQNIVNSKTEHYLEQRHRTFSDLVLRGKLCEAVRFFCERNTGIVLQPDELASDKIVFMDETIVSVLAGETHTKKTCSTLEAYDEMTIFIPVEIMEDMVKYDT